MNPALTPSRPTDRLGAWLLGLAITLSLIGYPLAGLASSALGLPSTTTAIPLRLLVVVVSGAMAFHFLSRRRPFRIDLAIIVFFWLYLLRLFWDYASGRFDDVDDALIFFIATVLIPALALMASARGFDERLTARLVFVVGSILCAGSIALDFLGIGADLSLTARTGRLSFEALNPISLGHVAVTTVIGALVLWRAPGMPGGRLAIAGGALVALYCLVLAASRGPVLALIVVVISFSVLRGRWGRIAAGGLGVLLVVPAILATQGVTIIDRFTDISDDVSAQERLWVQGNSIDQALGSPLFGNAYVETVSGQYPHNLILEAFMALGFVGLGLFLLISARAGVQAVVNLRAGRIFLPLLLVQYFIAGMFSGALWNAGPLFMVLVLFAGQTPLRIRVGGPVTASLPVR